MSGERAKPSSQAIEITYRFDPENPPPFFAPSSWQKARESLESGNETIGRFYDACRRGSYAADHDPLVVRLSTPEANAEPKGPDGLMVQAPFAVVLGCADARVPIELLFGQKFNDLFTIRIAGNVMGGSEVASLLYALNSFVKDSPSRLRSLKIVVALGHKGCGAVGATVDAYQNNNLLGRTDPIGLLLGQIAEPGLSVAVQAIDELLGVGASMSKSNATTLAAVTVHTNAAWTAMQARDVIANLGQEVEEKVGAVYGVFDPATLRVQAYPDPTAALDDSHLVPPPKDLDGLTDLARIVVRSMGRNSA